jgi:hypothetical protein
MKGNIFQCHGENTNKQQFFKMLCILEKYINKMFTYSQDIATVCKLFEIIPLTQPENLMKKEYEEDTGKKLIWETSMKTYMKRTDY